MSKSWKLRHFEAWMLCAMFTLIFMKGFVEKLQVILMTTNDNQDFVIKMIEAPQYREG